MHPIIGPTKTVTRPSVVKSPYLASLQKACGILLASQRCGPCIREGRRNSGVAAWALRAVDSDLLSGSAGIRT